MTAGSASPAPSNRSRHAAADRFARMVEASHGLLGEGGPDALTIRAVLDRAGLSRRAFYDCFTGKDDLVLAVIETALRATADDFERATQAIADPVARLGIIIRSIVAGRSPGSGAPVDRRLAAAVGREYLRLAQTRPEDIQRAIAPLLDLIARLLGEGIEQNRVRAMPTQRLALMIYNLMSTTVHAELLAEDGDALQARDRAAAAADEVWEFCRRAIAM